ncbi:hypothetical protein [Brevibacterium moorei]|uniref:hypothetical protein n=1 Tax=Brevibacterium moorei TaxID=2968457 RepID=UPI00211CA92E|nr:hypothetical protein [Brevibacterium sp. 68QC2CO]MCQ9384393.1 hypothetical protein [Brevibacterium sp. 68QC2CO]
MITLNELATQLGTVEESGITTPVRWDHIADFDQTLNATDGGDTEISEDDAAAIREAWTN